MDLFWGCFAASGLFLGGGEGLGVGLWDWTRIGCGDAGEGRPSGWGSELLMDFNLSFIDVVYNCGGRLSFAAKDFIVSSFLLDSQILIEFELEVERCINMPKIILGIGHGNAALQRFSEI